MKRHPAHDYSQPGGYFLTFVTADRRPLLVRIRGRQFHPSRAGLIVRDTWERLPEYYPGLMLDAFQVMPDHVHGILILTADDDGNINKMPAISIPRIMKSLKAVSTRKIRMLPGMDDAPVWQKGYVDRVIRSEKELEKFRFYIETNVLRKNLEFGE